ncbi:MAG: hypothetical protein KJP04_03245, partial [Arenicella sp.]|nr:hypothetical protein [Arenicella sp.]
AGEAGGSLYVNDELDASNLDNDEIGGDITLLGTNVGIFEEANVDASGDAGGGTILIGGEQQGGGDTATSEFVYLGESASVHSDAATDGDGGTVILFAENTARVHGDITARGGDDSGDGGFVETSGRLGFELPNNPDVSAANGDAGTWLIDPLDITVSADDFMGVTGASPFSPTGIPANLSTAVVEDALLMGDVIITTVGTTGGADGDIFWNTDLVLDVQTGNFDFGTLTLDSANDIFVNGSIITDNDITLTAVGDVSISSLGGVARVMSFDSSPVSGTATGGVISIDASDLLIVASAGAETSLGSIVPDGLDGGGSFLDGDSATSGLDIDLDGNLFILAEFGGEVNVGLAHNDGVNTVDVGGNFTILSNSRLGIAPTLVNWEAYSNTDFNIGGDFNIEAQSDFGPTAFSSRVFFENFGDQQPNPVSYEIFTLDAGGDINLTPFGDDSSQSFELFNVQNASLSAGGSITVGTRGVSNVELSHSWQRENEAASFTLSAVGDINVIAGIDAGGTPDEDGQVLVEGQHMFGNPNDYLFEINAGNNLSIAAGTFIGAGTAEIIHDGGGIFDVNVGNDLLINQDRPPTPFVGFAPDGTNFAALYMSAGPPNNDPGNTVNIDVDGDLQVNGYNGDELSVFLANIGDGDLNITVAGESTFTAASDFVLDAFNYSGGVTLFSDNAINITSGGSATFNEGNLFGVEVNLDAPNISVTTTGAAADIIWNNDLMLNEARGYFDIDSVSFDSANDIIVSGQIITDGDITLNAANMIQLGLAVEDVNFSQNAEVMSLNSDFNSATNAGGVISITANDLNILQDDSFDSSDNAHIATAAPRFSDFLDADPMSSHVEIDVANDFTLGFEQQFARGITQVLLGETDAGHTINVGGDFSFIANTLATETPVFHIFTTEGDTDIQVGGDFTIEALGTDSFATAEIADVFIGVLGDQQPNPISIDFFTLDVAGNINMIADGERSNIVFETQNTPDILIRSGLDFNMTSDNGSLVDLPSLWQRNDANATFMLDVGRDLSVIAGNDGFAIIDPQNLSGQVDNYIFEVTTGNNLTIASQNIGVGSFSDAEIYLSGGGLFNINVGNDLLINPDPPIALLPAANDSNYIALNRFGTDDPANAMNVDVVGNILINGYDQSGLSTFFANEAGGDLNITAGGNIDILGGNDVVGTVWVLADGTVNIEAGGDFTLAGGNVAGSHAIVESRSLNTINIT